MSRLLHSDHEAPGIDPVPPGVTRPDWSVMIPTYNCARFLGQAIQSVLAEDQPPERMQIEVVDDCSTADDPEAVVRDLGKGRVAFHRKASNQGANANFNTCIERSRGHLVHILHGDDFVAPGFYRTVARGLEAAPTAGMVVVRTFMVNREGEIDNLARRLTDKTEVFQTLPEQLYENAILTPGVVVKRTAYEEHGGFIPALIHVADWEMWDRLITLAGAIFVNQPLAFYRLFPENETGRLARSADNLREYLRLADVFACRHADFSKPAFESRVAERAWLQYRRFRDSGDAVAAEANFNMWRQLYRKTAPWNRRIRLDLTLAARKLGSQIKSRLKGSSVSHVL